MTKTVLTLIAAIGPSLPALALAATVIDANGDGVLTIDEVQAVYPDITDRTFMAMDVDADGTLDDDEVLAARQAGVLPPDDG